LFSIGEWGIFFVLAAGAMQFFALTQVAIKGKNFAS
jgi:hypothetical protein